MQWLQHPIQLTGRLVRLEPLGEQHFEALVLAGNDPRIWTNLPIDGTDPAVLKRELRHALLHRANGTQYPFAIIDQKTGMAIGTTRFLDLFREHRKLEIGWTWYAPAYWGTGHNLECKLLLLTYCFDTIQLNRVQLKTRDNNARSQAAIRKIGASFEGILRNDRIMPDGAIRDTHIFSIISNEWAQCKAALTARVNDFDLH